MSNDRNIILDCLYAPPVSYWLAMVDSGMVMLEDSSFYRKGSYRNRCHIYGANGLLRLSVPLIKGKHQRAVLKEVLISYDHPWQELHWQSLCSAYRSSPYFEFYEDELRDIYSIRFEKLIELNLCLMEFFCKHLHLSLPDLFTGKYAEDHHGGWTDLRERIRPGGNPDQLEYPQVFGHKHGFIPDLSVFDLLFNLGPAARQYLNDALNP